MAEEPILSAYHTVKVGEGAHTCVCASEREGIKINSIIQVHHDDQSLNQEVFYSCKTNS